MATIAESITKDLTAALKAHDDVRLRTLRMLRAALVNAAIESRASGELSDDAVLAVVKREAKKRRESAAAFVAGGRQDLAAGEEAELAVLQVYLPAEMPEAEVRACIERVMAGMSNERAFGTVMKAVLGELKGRADAGRVAQIIKELLPA